MFALKHLEKPWKIFIALGSLKQAEVFMCGLFQICTPTENSKEETQNSLFTNTCITQATHTSKEDSHSHWGAPRIRNLLSHLLHEAWNNKPTEVKRPKENILMGRYFCKIQYKWIRKWNKHSRFKSKLMIRFSRPKVTLSHCYKNF